MDFINTLINDLDLTGLVPELDTLTGWLQLLLQVAVKAGPVTMLVMGIIYVVAPPKEATHKAGFRTYFGMGSIQAWRVTQLFGGAAIALTGLVLTIIALIQSGGIAGQSLTEGALAAIELVKGQIICAAVLYVVLFLAAAVVFDRSGRCRFGWKLPFAVEEAPAVTEEAPEAEEAEAPEEIYVPEFYQEESSEPLRVEDIVIEGITDEENVF